MLTQIPRRRGLSASEEQDWDPLSVACSEQQKGAGCRHLRELNPQEEVEADTVMPSHLSTKTSYQIVILSMTVMKVLD